MKTVQLAIRDADYAQLLRSLLLRDGMHRVLLVDQPDLQLDGVVVVDENKFDTVFLSQSDPDRFVVLTRKNSARLSRVWDAGIRHVVFDDDPPNTAQLAIIAAELRQPKVASGQGSGDSDAASSERHFAPSLSKAGTRCRKSGLKNAHT